MSKTWNWLQLYFKKSEAVTGFLDYFSSHVHGTVEWPEIAHSFQLLISKCKEKAEKDTCPSTPAEGWREWKLVGGHLRAAN